MPSSRVFSSALGLVVFSLAAGFGTLAAAWAADEPFEATGEPSDVEAIEIAETSLVEGEACPPGLLTECPTDEPLAITVGTGDSRFHIILFGTLSGEMIFATTQPIPPSLPAFLPPSTGRREPFVDVHGKSTSFGLLVSGPEIRGFQSGGMLLTYFFGETVLENTTGLFLARGYVDLTNDQWRFAAGVQEDLFNPLVPNTINFDHLNLQGNVGFLRGQVRAERFIHAGDRCQWTLQAGLSEPLVTTYSSALSAVFENNGWPNVETRVAVALGEAGDRGRPFEWGASGVLGEIRTIGAKEQVTSQTWGIGTDVRVQATPWLAVRGEFFHGKNLGTYNGAALLAINPLTFEGFHSTGGWVELEVDLTQSLQGHLGAGLDDPLDHDGAAGQVLRNEILFGNLLWNVTDKLQVGLEISYLETSYHVLADNHGMVYHTRMQLSY
jgi:hypothetical protein